MTDDDKELVKRLREKADWLDPEIDMIEEWEALDAADRIEALNAENERLRTKNDIKTDTIMVLLLKIEELMAFGGAALEGTK